jgi:hypothetical protein
MKIKKIYVSPFLFPFEAHNLLCESQPHHFSFLQFQRFPRTTSSPHVIAAHGVTGRRFSSFFKANTTSNPVTVQYFDKIRSGKPRHRMARHGNKTAASGLVNLHFSSSPPMQ